MGGPARPLVASSEMACPEIAACLLLLVHVAIGEGLQECDDRKHPRNPGNAALRACGILRRTLPHTQIVILRRYPKG